MRSGQLLDHPLWGQVVTYGRDRAKVMDEPGADDITWHRKYWSSLTGLVTIPTDAHILFVGAGFGFLAEAAIDAGWLSVACCDTSAWIQAHKTDLAWRRQGEGWVQDQPNAREEILDRSVENPAQLKNALKSIFGNGTGEPDWLITESVLSSLTDPTDPFYDEGEGDADDLTPFLDNCDAVVAPGGTVLHIVAPTVRAPFNQKTLAEWKLVRPAHRYAPDRYGMAEVL
jgi:hypothetical protein